VAKFLFCGRAFIPTGAGGADLPLSVFMALFSGPAGSPWPLHGRARVEVKCSSPRSLWSAFQLVVIGNCPQGLRLRGAAYTQPIIEI
jgi:hypothetical protein